MLAPNTAPATNPLQSFSGLRFLLLEDACSLPQINNEASPEAAFVTPAIITPLHRQLTALCLHNPYWNDFRILNHFQKRGIKMSIEILAQLKKESKLDDRETICNTLIRLSTQGGLKLNSRQISYIERAKPEFRDRDLQSTQPGELVVYGRLFGRGVGEFGRVYLHTFIDMYTRQAFGKLSQDKSITAGFEVLKTNILPPYKARGYALDTILHSIQDANDLKEFNELENSSDFSSLGLQWLPTRRTFGVFEKLERHLVQNSFFENAPDLFANLQIAFERLLARYNANNRLFARRTLLDY
ncbi:MAG: hypothetical protein H6Q73_3877 [Firmicutes bacterium]|nr:hypothetical protein [Bacillota bacterium]